LLSAVQAKTLDLKSVEDLQGAIQQFKHQEYTFTLVRKLIAEEQL